MTAPPLPPSQDKPLLDFVFAVSHPSHWHAINMQQNPHHYSLPMRLLGSNAVSWMQEKGIGAEVWFNVDVEVNGKVRSRMHATRGAVMNCAVLILVVSFLRHSCSSTASSRSTPSAATCSTGRRSTSLAAFTSPFVPALHLPALPSLLRPSLTFAPSVHQVRILQNDARVRLANQVNLASALRTALLLLPESFTEIELFEEIAGISYRGDFRMRVGENPHKVRNIVAAQLPAFRSLYGGLLKSFWKSVYTIGEVHPTTGGPHEQGGVRLMRQDLSAAVRASTAVRLPVGLRDKVLAHYERKWNLEGAMLRAKEHEAHDAPDRAEHKVNLDVQYMWERIVQDDEFKSIMNQSASRVSRSRPRGRDWADVGASVQPPEQACRRLSRARRSTSRSRASSRPARSSRSDTSSPSSRRSGGRRPPSRPSRPSSRPTPTPARPSLTAPSPRSSRRSSEGASVRPRSPLPLPVPGAFSPLCSRPVSSFTPRCAVPPFCRPCLSSALVA